MSKQKNQVNDLLAAIKRQPTEAAPASVEEEVPPSEQPPPKMHFQRVVSKAKVTDAETGGLKGKQTQFWLHDVDRKLIRELSAWLAGQGLRPTDSMIIRAALRMAKTGGGLIEAYWEAAKVDGRLKRDGD